MSTIIRLTLGTGETQEVPFDAKSIVTIRTRVQRDPGQAPVDEDRSFTNVTAFDIVDADTGEETTVPDVADPTVATPGDAINHATSLALADAGAHVEKALAKFPGDEDLLALQDELSAIVRGDTSNTWPPAAPVEATPTPVDTPAVDPTVAPVADPVADPVVDPTLETPTAAIEHAQTLDVADAAAHIDAALEKFPGDTDLVEAQTELQAIIAANTPPQA